ncbi:MAG: hypothetical protein KDI01_04340 [Halioglobus sp.]|nr:hypothetical protein [Halioglobus sp.]
MQFIRPQPGRTVLLMLVMVLAQSLVGAVEAGLQSGSPVDTAGHHDAGAYGHYASGTHVDTGGDAPAAAEHEAGCDHCCKCHGHCSHLAAPGRCAGLSLPPQATCLPSPRPSHAEVFPPAPYRPPIA